MEKKFEFITNSFDLDSSIHKCTMDECKKNSIGEMAVKFTESKRRILEAYNHISEIDSFSKFLLKITLEVVDKNKEVERRFILQEQVNDTEMWSDNQFAFTKSRMTEKQKRLEETYPEKKYRVVESS